MLTDTMLYMLTGAPLANSNFQAASIWENWTVPPAVNVPMMVLAETGIAWWGVPAGWALAAQQMLVQHACDPGPTSPLNNNRWLGGATRSTQGGPLEMRVPRMRNQLLKLRLGL